MTADLVRFVEVVPASLPADDLLALGAPPRGRSHPTLQVLVVTLVVLLATARADAVTGAIATPSPVAATAIIGALALPVPGPPRLMVRAADVEDTVWLVQGRDRLARIVGGHVTATRQLAGPAIAVTTDPLGNLVYALTEDRGPAVAVLDGATLALRGTVAVAAGLTDLAMAPEGLYAVGTGRLVELDPRTLRMRRTVALAGVTSPSTLRVFRMGVGVALTVLGRQAGNTVLTSVQLDGTEVTVRQTGPLTPPVRYAQTLLGPWVVSGSRSGSVAGSGPVVGLGPADAVLRSVTLAPLLHTTTLHVGDGAWDYPGHGSWVSTSTGSTVVVCRGPDGGPTGQVDLAATAGSRVITGPVVRFDQTLYAGTDQGVVRSGVGTCR